MNRPCQSIYVPIYQTEGSSGYQLNMWNTYQDQGIMIYEITRGGDPEKYTFLNLNYQGDHLHLFWDLLNSDYFDALEDLVFMHVLWDELMDRNVHGRWDPGAIEIDLDYESHFFMEEAHALLGQRYGIEPPPVLRGRVSFEVCR